LKFISCVLLSALLSVGCGPRQHDHDEIVKAIAHSDSVRLGLLGFSSESMESPTPDSAKADSQAVDTVDLWHHNLRKSGEM
jgi:hypothetical protein